MKDQFVIFEKEDKVPFLVDPGHTLPHLIRLPIEKEKIEPEEACQATETQPEFRQSPLVQEDTLVDTWEL